ncbi:hypothetical protein BAMA_19225 [Bacillus manliponensis]|uniref:HTH luxR-type domain-containing protein n=1 Tax=Bacillus manliponensis TaxID=574376 RepID=A0A073K070_9BACI|nr:LuxR C-terminal-related transcriptional regulator [Bacillus manliponensis]KEK19906.1 hypothetical protein BAMA_19225 [Bacillus manliponensis]
MLDQQIKRYLTNLQDISDRNEITKKILEGAQYFFPFSRVTILTFSPINFITELFLTKEKDTFPSHHLRDDIRNLPYFLEAAIKEKTVYIINAKKSQTPIRYIEQFNLCTYLIVPLRYANTIGGFIVLDQYENSHPCNHQMVQSIESYFLLSGKLLYSTMLPKQFISLSKRETEVLQQSAYGYSNKEISNLLEISEFTVRDYVTSAVKKLNVCNRTQAVAEALRQGLIQ